MALAAVLTVFLIAGCAGGNGSEAISSSPASAVPLSEQQLEELAAFLNEEENNAFVGRVDYERPEELDLSAVLYDAPCPHERIVTETTPKWKMKRQDVDAFLREKTGLSLEEVDSQYKEWDLYDSYLGYEKDTDSFVMQHGDTWLQEIRVTGGERTADGLYKVEYSPGNHSNEVRTVTLRPVSGGYQFVSDVKSDVGKEN